MLTSWLHLDSASTTQIALLEWLVRVTVLCLTAAIVSKLLQRRSAELAHRVWILAIVGVCLLPALSWFVPGWHLTVATAGADATTDAAIPVSRSSLVKDVSRTAHDHLATQRHPREDIEALAGPQSTEAATPVEPSSTTTGVSELPSPVEPFGSASADRWSLVRAVWFEVLICAWLIGAGLLLLRLASAMAALAAVIRRSTGAAVNLQTTVEQLAAELSIRQRYEVRLLAPSAMPMACWFGRSFILLPGDIVYWPVDLQRTVIAHELGHIARRDAWSDFLTQFVSRALWFHPLLWLARRSVQTLRERACDEWVLACGQFDSRMYAGHLLDVVTRCTIPANTLAPAMARKSELEIRLRAVLSGTRVLWSRSPLVKCSILLTGVGVIGLLAAGRVVPALAEPGQGAQSSKAPSILIRRSAEPVAADAPAITVGGILVTPEGKPTHGATVILRVEDPSFYSMGVSHGRELLAEVRTDAAGRFLFEKIGIPARFATQISSLRMNKGGARVLAWKEGSALTWAQVVGLTHQTPLRLVLAPEAEVNGIVRDKTGKPLEGVSINLAGITKKTTEIDNSFLENEDLRLFFMEGKPGATITNQAGRFALHHLPADRRIMISFVKPGQEWQSLVVDTSSDGKPKEIVSAGAGLEKPVQVQRSPLTVLLQPAPMALVRVFDHQGKGVTEGCIQVTDAKGYGVGRGEVHANGEAPVSVTKPGILEFDYVADPLRPQLGVGVTAEVKAGEPPPVVQVHLPEAKWLTGRVVDAETAKGIAGAYLSFVGETKSGATGNPPVSSAVSGVDGAFRIPVAIGGGSLGFMHPVHGYFPPTYENASNGKTPPRTQINLAATGEPFPVTLPLSRGMQINGKVSDSNGKPAVGATLSFYPDDWMPVTTGTTNYEGRFELSGMSPYKNGRLIVHGAAGSVSVTVTASPDQDIARTLRKNLDLTLKQGGVTVAGRVLHNGKPRAGVLMKLTHTIGKALPNEPIPGRGGAYRDPNRFFPAGEVRTDSEGRYRIGGLEVGERFQFQIEDPENMRDESWPYQSDTATRYDQVVPANKPELQLPDVNLVSTGQKLRGLVVDLKGNPAEGFDVSASQASGASLSRVGNGPPPWTKSDARGAFELSGLPDLPIELMVYKSHQTGFIKYIRKFRPSKNQQDIRIVMDPTLHEEIESLDDPKKKTSPIKE